RKSLCFNPAFANRVLHPGQLKATGRRKFAHHQVDPPWRGAPTGIFPPALRLAGNDRNNLNWAPMTCSFHRFTQGGSSAFGETNIQESSCFSHIAHTFVSNFRCVSAIRFTPSESRRLVGGTICVNVP